MPLQLSIVRHCRWRAVTLLHKRRSSALATKFTSLLGQGCGPAFSFAIEKRAFNTSPLSCYTRLSSWLRTSIKEGDLMFASRFIFKPALAFVFILGSRPGWSEQITFQRAIQLAIQHS